MHAGELRHSVMLERRRQFTGAAMTLDSVYEPVTQAFAKIEGVGGAAYQAGVQIEERITHRITIRFRQRTDFDHVSRGDQRFRLRRIRDPQGDRRWLIIEAEEVLAGADVL